MKDWVWWMLKQPKIRSRSHLMFIASLPCVICSREDVQAAHLRSGNAAGMGLKSGDDKTLPLCISCHKNQHENSEIMWWEPHGGYERANKLALSLFEVTGQHAKAMRVINEWRR